MMRMMKKRRVPDRKSVGIKWMAFIILLDGECAQKEFIAWDHDHRHI